MKKRIIWIAIAVLVVFIGAAGAFMYKITVGWPIYETKKPDVAFSDDDKNIVVFSKTNGYRHSDGITAAEKLISDFAKEHGWNVFITENGAVHSPELLEKVDVLIWNNVTGKVLRTEQREAMKSYVENGGSFIGLHGAGDFSHHWEWYEETLIGAKFSHHTMNPQLQEGTIYPEGGSPASADSWVTIEEWYVFNESPRVGNTEVLWNLEESDIDPNGNLGFILTGKDWGMGDDHPMIWRRKVGKGKSYYSAFGHDATNYNNTHYQQILLEGLNWSMK